VNEAIESYGMKVVFVGLGQVLHDTFN
jgi:hypothetical protein